MDKDRIQTLLDRFFDGTSTGQEEELLMQYFAKEENVPAEWKAEQQMFRQLAEARHTLPPVPKGLEERLKRNINEWAKEKQNKPRMQPRRANRWWIVGAAACLLLVGSIGLKMMQPSEEESLTPERAYAETERALYLFAHTLNKGVEQMATAQQATLRMQERINKTLKQLNE